MLNPTLHPDSQQLCIFQTFCPPDEPYLELELIFCSGSLHSEGENGSLLHCSLWGFPCPD